MGDIFPKGNTQKIARTVEGKVVQCACASGGMCFRAMHKKGTGCDRTVLVTKNSRHRICKGCRSAKNKRDGSATSPKAASSAARPRGRPKRKSDDIMDAATAMEAMGTFHEDSSSEGDSAPEQIVLMNRREEQDDFLQILATQSAAELSAAPDSGPLALSRPQRVVNEKGQDGDNHQLSGKSYDSSIPRSFKRVRGRGRPREDETSDNLPPAAKRAKTQTTQEFLKARDSSQKLMTRNGDEVSLMPCVCVKGGYCHRADHLLGQPCDNVCRISKNVRHRVCKACRSGGKNRAKGRTSAKIKADAAPRVGLSIQNPENIPPSEMDVEQHLDFSLKAASQVVAMLGDDSPRSFGIITPGGNLSLRRPIDEEGMEEDAKTRALRADEDSEVQVLADVEKAPLTRDGERVLMWRQPEYLEGGQSSITFAQQEKSLLSKVESGPITYSNVATPREVGAVLEVEEDEELGMDGINLSSKSPRKQPGQAVKNKQATFFLMKPEEADAETTEPDEKDVPAPTVTIALPDGVTPRTVTAVTEVAELLSRDAS